MAKRFEPTLEQLHKILNLYEKLQTYSAVAKEMKISAPVISRIIKEHGDSLATPEEKEEEEESLTLPTPAAVPDRETVRNFFFIMQS